MPSTEPTILTTHRNGPHAIFERIYNTVDRKKVSIGVDFYVNSFLSEDRWTFGSDNISELLNAAMALELKFFRQEISSALVHFREYKNDKVLFYRFLIFPNGNVEFFTGEESELLDSQDFETGEPLPLQENHIYLDSDFLQADADLEFIPQTIKVIGREDIIEMLAGGVGELEYDDVDFSGHEDDLATCEKYNVSSIEGYYLLALEFENELYDSDDLDDPNNCLVAKKEQFIALLDSETYGNEENDEIIASIDEVMEIIELLGIGHYPEVQFDLPMDDELELTVNYVDGVGDLVISPTQQFVIYIDMVDGEEPIAFEADIDEVEKIEEIKELIAKRLKK